MSANYVNIFYIYFSTDTNTKEKSLTAIYEILENPKISKNLYVQ